MIADIEPEPTDASTARSMSGHATRLRGELIQRARSWAGTVGAPWYESLSGTAPVMIFEPYQTAAGPRHGNFIDASYLAALADVHWAVRLNKPHPRRGALPPDRGSAAKELDSCTSSDALLINVMCHPGSGPAVAKVLGADGPPELGIGGAVPLRSGSGLVADRSEIDLGFRGDRGSLSLIVEAKLTERDFTNKERSIVERYADFAAVFEPAGLRQTADEVGDYQLIRNLLAAHYHGARFVLLYDERRSDLLERFDHVIAAVRPKSLVARSRAVTWQELSVVGEAELREFLEQKYGIGS